MLDSREEPPEGEIRRLDGEAWNGVTAGLRHYRAGLMIQLALLGITLALAIWAVMSKRGGGLQDSSLVLPSVQLIIAVVMLAGLIRYAKNVPREVAARPSAFLGVGCLLLSGAAQMYAYSQVLRLSAMQRQAESAGSMWGMPSLHEVEQIVRRMQWSDAVATLVGLIGLMLILRSLRLVARWIGDYSLTSAAGWIAAGMVPLVIVALGMRWYMAVVRRPSPKILILGGAIGLIWGLTMIHQYIRYLGEMIERIRSQQSGYPSAHVVAGGSPLVERPERER